MASYFNRKWAVAVDDRLIEDLRITFKVMRTLSKEPNTCDVNITNLSAATRSSMVKTGAKIVLQAGYQDNFSTIFSGDARTIDHVRDGSDWTTKIQCGDGERAYQFTRVSEVFAPGAKVDVVVQYIASQLGLGMGNALEQVRAVMGGVLEQFSKGITLHGKAVSELDKVMRSLGLTWSIQDGSLQVLKESETLAERAVVLSASSGLVGSPEHNSPKKKNEAPVMKIKCLLNPLIRPGTRIQLEALNRSGLFKAVKVIHSGDTAGQDWYTEVEAQPTT